MMHGPINIIFPEYYLPLISLRMQYGYISVVPHYLKLDTFLNGLLTTFILLYGPAFCLRDMNLYFVLSVFAYRPIIPAELKLLSSLLITACFHSVYSPPPPL